MSVLELFWRVDDFCRNFEPKWRAQFLANGLKQCNRAHLYQYMCRDVIGEAGSLAKQVAETMATRRQ